MRVAVPVSSIGLASWQRPWLALAQVFLLTTCVLPLLYLRNKSITTDEVTHLPAGYSYFLRKSIVYNPQHPPLIKEICALPLLFMDVKVPPIFLRTSGPLDKTFSSIRVLNECCSGHESQWC
jgi:predicted membrane-bound dolichyl-phosphate-mannose-protein mannosyltransferase